MYTLPALFIWALGYIRAVDGMHLESRDTATQALISGLFSFNSISNMTTCEPALITWIYTPLGGEDLPNLVLSITNSGVKAPSPPLSSTLVGSFSQHDTRRSYFRRDDITEQISAPIPPSLEVFEWSSVNVSGGGWYALVATVDGDASASKLSLPFFIQDGSDVSCTLPPASSTSSGPTSTGVGSGSPTSTGDPSSSGGTLPVSGVSSSKVNKGAIAGGVIGGLAVIAAAIAAFFYLRYASASTAPNGAARRWADLGSTDSKAKAYPKPRSSGGGAARHHSQSDSVGAMLSSRDSNVYVIGSVGIDSRPSRMNDNDGLDYAATSDFYPSQEKISGSPSRSNPFSESGHDDDDDAVPLDLITPLPGTAVTRNSSTSTSSYMNTNFSRPRSHPGSPYASPTSPTGGPFGSGEQTNITAATSESSPAPSSYPPTPSPALASGSSQDGGAAAAAAPLSRRTPRKPVPQYNPTDPALTAMPMPALPQADTESSSNSSSREGSVRSGVAPHLSHKASFGAEGRAVHYLIPDMPPPQRD
ncbi:hypothetical protein C8R46DRAFT_1117860 [Mycena filopes]|nr:hypothetical protein C8R46DRAFT_1117860 [Mycena filopes]